MTIQAFEVQEKLASLEISLLESTPGMATLLRDIHRSLKQDPDIITILEDEEVAILVKGLKKQTGVEIATKAAKKKSVKSLKKISIDEL